MKNLLYLLFLPLFVSSQNLPNQGKIDDLVYQLKTKATDTSKANLYYKISKEYKRKDLDKLIFYNDKLLELSEKINYQKGIGLYYYNLTFINENLGKDRTVTAKKAADIFFEIKETKYYLLLRYHLAFAYMSTSKYKEAKNVINESLPIATKSIFANETAYLYELLGLINYYENFINTSLLYYKKALDYYNLDKTGKNNKSQLFLYIAFSHTDLGNYKEAINYLDLANSKGESIDINIEKAVVLNKMGLYEEALKILLNNRKTKLYKPKYVNDYNTHILADTYYNLEKYQNAIVYLKEISIEESMLEFAIQYYNLLGDCYTKQNKLTQATLYNDQALALVDSLNIPHLKQNVFLSKSNIEEALGNNISSLSYYKKFHEVKEESDAKNNANRIQELQFEFDVVEKNDKIKNLQLEKLEKEIKITKQREFIILISIALLIASLSIFTFIKINKVSKRKNKLIEFKNKKLNIAQKLTQKSLQEKELLLKEIHHRVKNNMQLVISLLKIQAKASKQLDIESFILTSENRIHSMALIHEYLYESKNINYVNFEEYTQKLISTIQIIHGDFKNITVKMAIQKTDLDIQTSVSLGLIINELLINAYKYAFDGKNEGVIQLQLFHDENFYHLIISDDGIGMNITEEIDKSVGLQIVRLLVSQIKGVMKIEINEGTHFIIKFPKTKEIAHE